MSFKKIKQNIAEIILMALILCVLAFGNLYLGNKVVNALHSRTVSTSSINYDSQSYYNNNNEAEVAEAEVAADVNNFTPQISCDMGQ